ncbi:hypothetical protein [Hymenobacter psychrotolerans]|uniref:Uncharacterized protein n=1 Tax=Hymenobacter psychrotolerans DSM 18569 TaxID=1121959 RepID=A0A1M6URC8_9BACT|nr:hypothetical protein [Hymenobacter psychrotolerans]SHK71733.1 hypothetical protein SAMN02746009_01451 [Hymenobacter psychrotolerans DSM 18569]
MFTALQFSQLLAAAWSGPAACHFATISHYVAPEGYTKTQYTASFHIGQACHLGQAECPFAAVAAAVQAFAAAQPAPSLLAAVVVAHAAQVLRAAAGQLAGVPVRRPGFSYRCQRHRCARFRRRFFLARYV